MTKDKKFLRQCCSCREYKNKDDLIKITKDFKSGKLIINNEEASFGRSVYICKNSDCILKALKKKKIEYSLKSELSENIKEKLSTVLTN